MDASLQVRSSSLVPKIAPSQVKLVSLRIVWLTATDLTRVLSTEFQSQVVSDAAREFVLNSKRIRDGVFGAVTSPKDAAIFSVHQAHRHASGIFAFQHASLQDCGDAETPANIAGIDLFSFQAEDRAA